MSSGKTSTTAYIIAASLAKLARLPQWRGNFSDEAMRLNTALMQHARDTPLKYLISWLSPALSLRVMDYLFIPGLMQHFMCRKRYIESQLAAAVARGVRQVVIPGAGLDTLAVRVASAYGNVQFFEIELPRTQALKLAVFKHIGLTPAGNCHFVAADLARDKLEKILSRQPTFERQAPTLVILEGVLMFLSENEVKEFLRDMHTVFTGQLTLLFGATVASDHEHDAWTVRTINKLLSHECMKWVCPSAKMESFLHALSYRLKDRISYKQLQQPYRTADELQKLPDEDENYYTAEKV